MAVKRIVRCQSTTSFSSIVGNLTSFAIEFFKGRFPKGFFKDIIVSEELLNRRLDQRAIQKCRMPYMIIKPELSLDSLDLPTFVRWSFDNHYIAHNDQRKDYFGIFKDEERQIYMYHIPDRIKIRFSFTIKVPTAMYMYNALYYLNRNFEKDGYEYLNHVRLQTELPRSFISILSKELGYNFNNIEDKEKFNSYIYKNSLDGIEEKISMSTGNSIYNLRYIVNVLNKYPDVSEGSKNRKDMIIDDCTLTYAFEMENWIPSRFLLEIPESNLDYDTLMEEDSIIDSNTYKFNMVLDTHYIKPKIENRHLLLRRSYVPEVNVEYDSLSFATLIHRELDNTLKYLKSQNALNEHYFEVRVMCGNKFLPKDHFSIDYENYILYTKLPMKNTTYTILIYGDMEYLNRCRDALDHKQVF